MRKYRCVRARRVRVSRADETRLVAIFRRLAEISPMAVVGDSQRPAEIVKALIDLARPR